MKTFQSLINLHDDSIDQLHRIHIFLVDNACWGRIHSPVMTTSSFTDHDSMYCGPLYLQTCNWNTHPCVTVDAMCFLKLFVINMTKVRSLFTLSHRGSDNSPLLISSSEHCINFVVCILRHVFDQSEQRNINAVQYFWRWWKSRFRVTSDM